jgi:cytochrome c oxidase subunit 2
VNTISPEKGHAADDAERRWAIVSVGLIGLVLAVIAFTGIHWASMPPSGIEPIDPTTLHVAGEFVEQNLGAQLRPDGSVIVRLIGQQYSFNPQCVVSTGTAKSNFGIYRNDKRGTRILGHRHECQRDACTWSPGSIFRNITTGR